MAKRRKTVSRKKLTRQLASRKDVKNAPALAAWIISRLRKRGRRITK